MCYYLGTMQPENNELDDRFVQLRKVTPLSKYLALALFIIMPFIGGWIGYMYAPEKVVVVEKVVTQETSMSQEEKTDIVLTDQKPEIHDNSESIEIEEYIEVEETKLDHNMFNYELAFEDMSDWVVYKNPKYGFSLRHPADAKVVETVGSEGEVEFFLDDLNDNASRLTPRLWVADNNQGVKITDFLIEGVDMYIENVYTSTVDGRPSFWTVSAENGLTIGTVVTEKYIFRLIRTGNVTFDERIVGSSESNVDWPTQVRISHY